MKEWGGEVDSDGINISKFSVDDEDDVSCVMFSDDSAVAIDAGGDGWEEISLLEQYGDEKDRVEYWL